MCSGYGSCPVHLTAPRVGGWGLKYRTAYATNAAIRRPLAWGRGLKVASGRYMGARVHTAHAEKRSGVTLDEVSQAAIEKKF